MKKFNTILISMLIAGVAYSQDTLVQPDYNQGKSIKSYSTTIGEIETFNYLDANLLPGIGIRKANKELLLIPYFTKVSINKKEIVCRLVNETVTISLTDLENGKGLTIPVTIRTVKECAVCYGKGKVPYTQGMAGVRTETVIVARKQGTSPPRNSNPAGLISCTTCNGKGSASITEAGSLSWNQQLQQYQISL